jgi:predicted ester cyclase
MSVEDTNKAIVRHFVKVLQEFFRTGEAGLVDSLVYRVLANNIVQHISGMPPEAQSLEGFKQLLPALRQGFPDALFEVENLVAEGDTIAFRL